MANEVQMSTDRKFRPGWHPEVKVFLADNVDMTVFEG